MSQKVAFLTVPILLLPFSAIAQEIEEGPEFSSEQSFSSCQLGASGDGCIFDLQGTATGTLIVCTKARVSGQRWRATAVQALVGGAASKVGTGSTSSWTGCASRAVVSGGRYEVLVNIEPPLPTSFPATVDVKFGGPVSLVSPAPRPRSTGGSEEPQTCAQLTGRPEADVENIGCGALVQCRLDPAGDTDAFTFVVPAGGPNPAVVSINIAGASFTRWQLFGPSGNLIGSSYGQAESGPLAAGTYRIVASNALNYVSQYGLSLHGVSQSSFNCGINMNYGDLKTGRLDIAGDTDAFRFTAASGDVASINIAGGSFTQWKLFGPTGNFITSSYGAGQAGPLSAGVHTIKVSNALNYVTNYTLSLQKVAGP